MITRPEKIDDIIRTARERLDEGSLVFDSTILLIDYIEDLERNQDPDVKTNLKDPGNKMIQCARCKKKSRVNTVSLVQTYFTEDGGYCIGDRLVACDELDFKCPKCGIRNRMVPQELIRKNKPYFKDTIHDKEGDACPDWVNYYQL